MLRGARSEEMSIGQKEALNFRCRDAPNQRKRASVRRKPLTSDAERGQIRGNEHRS
ncbi:hypothetical protein CK5_16170 [Blautia obeum A2-162]|uniref:Uncharacterized protein n=1 Tax=Blautia obeum A2-162 TaxID=657314 RepID=D4LQH1_9FIRM|nr:hypothetical protein CK5_16170 [Blautia obeum A2-162]